MKSILVACASRQTAERGLRIAADLSVASGARLSLVRVRNLAIAPDAAAGLEAIGRLSDVLFTSHCGRGIVPAFAPREADGWLAAMPASVAECWETAHPDSLPFQVHSRQPDLVITCDGGLARTLVAHTTAPVWQVRSKHRERPWFSLRKLRCAVRGSRATEWAGAFAAGLGAELETMRTGLFRTDHADLVVVAREERASLLSARAMQPVIVV